jgi:lycopene cyclase domain-containing protein
MSPPGTYLYMELALLAYAVGFGWELWNIKRLCSPRFLAVVVLLAAAWFALDFTAIYLGVWSFPEGGTLPFRILLLPIEECILFFIHTMACYLFIRMYAKISS